MEAYPRPDNRAPTATDYMLACSVVAVAALSPIMLLLMRVHGI